MASHEELVSQLAFERGLLTPVQLSEALSARRGGESGGIVDVLIAKGYLTREQADELSREVGGAADGAPADAPPQPGAPADGDGPGTSAPDAGQLPSIVPPSRESDRAAKPTIEPPSARGAPAGGAGNVRVVAGYDVLGKIGRGAMGSVYRAKKIDTGDIVALKVLPPSAATRELIARFKRESEIVKGLDHPNIVKCFDFGYDRNKDCHFCALELVEGENLRDMIARLGTVPEQEAVTIARQLANALNYAFGSGLIHRDVKPANVMISRGGVVKLLDLGLARPVESDGPGVTMAGTFVGSPYYASPEQAKADTNIDFRADIYSLGATIYYMVAGHPPFEGSNVTEVLIKQLDEQLPWPEGKDAELSRRLGLVAAKMMAKDPADRYQTPTEMSLDLDIIGQGTDPVIASKAAVLSTIALPGWPTVGKAKRPRRTAHADRRRKPTTRHEAVRGASPEGAGGSPSGAKWGLVAGGVVVLGLVGVLAFVFSRESAEDAPPSPVATPGPDAAAPVGTAPVAAAPDAADAEQGRERVARERFAAAKRRADESPDDFAGIAAGYRKALAAGKGTAIELEADAALVELGERWKVAAGEALAEAKGKAAALVENGDYDGAIAVFEGIPKGLASKVVEAVVAETTAVHQAAGAKIDAAVVKAEALLAGGDTAGARAALRSIEDVDFKQGQDVVAPRVMALLMKTEEADRLAEQAKADKEDEKLSALLAEFEGFLSKGQYARAAERVTAAARAPEHETMVDQLRAAANVAGELHERRAAMIASAEARVGRPISLATDKGVRRGTLKEVSEASLVVVSQRIINGRVTGENRYEVAWSELPDDMTKEFASDWEPDGADGEIAKVYLALGRDDAEAAAGALAAAGEHPLAKHLAAKLAPPAPEPVTAGAGAAPAWPPTLAQVAKCFRCDVKSFDPATLTVTLHYGFESPDQVKDWALGEFGRKPDDRMGVNNGRLFLKGEHVWALATGVFTRVAMKADLSLHGEGPSTAALAAFADGQGNAYNFYPVNGGRHQLMAKWVAGKPQRLSERAPSPLAGRRRGLIGFACGGGKLRGWIGDGQVASVGDTSLTSGRVGLCVSGSTASLGYITIKGSLDEKWLRSKLGGGGARPAVVPPDAVEFGGHWYKFYERAEPVSWHEAKAFCEKQGGHLITITSPDEQTFATDMALLRKKKGTWIGLTEEGHPDDWRWVTGEPLTFKGWEADEPNNWGGAQENWAALYPAQWCDVPAKLAGIASFICEWEPGAGAGASRPANVPPDAAEFGGHWYKMHQGRRTYAEATAAAKQAGGYLACITSAAENDFVAKLAVLPNRRIVLLGGSDLEAEGRWRWVSGEPFVFKAWHPGEPEGGRTQNFLGMWADGTGKWADVQRDHPLIAAYVCEWGAPDARAASTGAATTPSPAPVALPATVPAGSVKKTGLLGTYFNGTKWGIHFTQVPPTCSVFVHGGLSPHACRVSGQVCHGCC
ncbi:MAG: protein kinase domain-containing protein, partial [Planctomycetota bacterium]